jgi:hypothetical protein
VPIIAFFMDPSPIEDLEFFGEARVFMKTIHKIINLNLAPIAIGYYQLSVLRAFEIVFSSL